MMHLAKSSEAMAFDDSSTPTHAYQYQSSNTNLLQHNISKDSIQESSMSTYKQDVKDPTKKLWNQLRFNRMGPERRGYHTSVIHDGVLYVHGGQDIDEGTLDNIWSLDLNRILQLRDIVDKHRQNNQSTTTLPNQSVESVQMLKRQSTILDAPESDFGW